jgi:hypothetical protein
MYAETYKGQICIAVGGNIMLKNALGTYLTPIIGSLQKMMGRLL